MMAWGLKAQLVTRSIGGLTRFTPKIRNSIQHQHRLLPPVSAMSTTAMPTNSIQCDASLIPGFLRWIDICNNGKAAQDSGQFLPFEIDNETVGYLSERYNNLLFSISKLTKQIISGTTKYLHLRCPSFSRSLAHSYVTYSFFNIAVSSSSFVRTPMSSK